MIFDSPLPFREALLSRAVKQIMPTHLSSAELAQLDVDIRERTLFSARTANEHYLGRIDQVITDLINPRTGIRETDGKPVTEGLDPATARLKLKEALREIGYEPDPEKRGTIQDLSSDQRLNLVIETNVDMAHGYGHFAQGQDPEVLDQWPAQELFRAEDREQPRDWHVRWVAAANAVGDDAALRVMGETGGFTGGRMIARKDSPIWAELSAFGQPYPPFDFNSGMDVRDIDRDEAVEVGLITDEDVIEPQHRPFEMEAA